MAEIFSNIANPAGGFSPNDSYEERLVKRRLYRQTQERMGNKVDPNSEPGYMYSNLANPAGGYPSNDSYHDRLWRKELNDQTRSREGLEPDDSF